MKSQAGIFLLIIMACVWCFSEGEDTRRLNVSGRLAVDNGQIVNSHYLGKRVPFRLWVNRGYLNLRFQSTFGEKLRVSAEPEVKVWFNTYPSTMINTAHVLVPFTEYSWITLAEARGVFSPFGNDNPSLMFSAGIFPFKYNPDARNLGEYLFRSGTYSPYISSGFEYQFMRLSGFHLSSELFGFLQQDLFLHGETQVLPLHDWSLSYCIGADFNLFTAGSGISFHHWFPVDDQFTRPKNIYNSNNFRNVYRTETGDTGYYTFKGIKLMGRWAFDPKRLMPATVSERFGKNDLRLYTEAAVLGVKNYRAFMPHVTGADTAWIPDTVNNFYGDLKQRIPIMAGFVFPTCGLLDILSLEIESYPWPEKNVFYDQQNQYYLPRPVTIADTGVYSRKAYAYDTWKWSINARKTVVNGVELVGQVARDHLRHDVYQEGQRDPEEALTRSNEWAWFMRLQYHF
ncbi:MAG: hypothetical protein JXA71_13410 [Chitinispirillaceae bacterium]|nr:hypothetical protein [Chitinispirillaceae bacterium]